MGIKSSRTTPSPLRGEGWGEGDIGRQSGNTPHLNPLPQGERKDGNQELLDYSLSLEGRGLG